MSFFSLVLRFWLPTQPSITDQISLNQIFGVWFCCYIFSCNPENILFYQNHILNSNYALKLYPSPYNFSNLEEEEKKVATWLSRICITKPIDLIMGRSKTALLFHFSNFLKMFSDCPWKQCNYITHIIRKRRITNKVFILYSLVCSDQLTQLPFIFARQL